MEENQVCDHIKNIKELIQPKDLICDECVKSGSSWVHLRTCQTCGATLCCDSSPNQHMTKHFQETHHPLVISAQQGEKWLWCYEDEVFAEYD